MARLIDQEEEAPLEAPTETEPAPYPVPNLSLVGVKWKTTLVAFLLVCAAGLVALSFCDFIFDPGADIRRANIESAEARLSELEDAQRSEEESEALAASTSSAAASPRAAGEAVCRSQNALLAQDVSDADATASALALAIPYLADDPALLSPWLWVASDSAKRAWSFDTPLASADGPSPVLWTLGEGDSMLAWASATWDPGTNTFSGIAVHVTSLGAMLSSATPQTILNRIGDDAWRHSIDASGESASAKALADAIQRGKGGKR